MPIAGLNFSASFLGTIVSILLIQGVLLLIGYITKNKKLQKINKISTFVLLIISLLLFFIGWEDYGYASGFSGILVRIGIVLTIIEGFSSFILKI